MDIPRISPEQAHRDMTERRALLVCAYESDQKFRDNYLEGASSVQQLRGVEDWLPPQQEMIFYCA